MRALVFLRDFCIRCNCSAPPARSDTSSVARSHPFGRLRIDTVVFLSIVGLSALGAGCSGKKSAREAAQTSAPAAAAPLGGRSNGGAIAASTEDGQWTLPAKNYASTRFSGLDEITTGNVGNLRLAWTFETGILRGQEAAPLVVNNTMYVVTPFPNMLYALDLTKPGAPLKWVY